MCSQHYMESTLTIDKLGNKTWLNSKGQYHNENGPAFESANGYKEYWINGQWHRLDGPAIIFTDESKWWYVNGQLHREDGPAIIRDNGSVEYWLNGVEQDPSVEKPSVIETITTSLLVPLKTKRLIELD